MLRRTVPKTAEKDVRPTSVASVASSVTASSHDHDSDEDEEEGHVDKDLDSTSFIKRPKPKPLSPLGAEIASVWNDLRKDTRRAASTITGSFTGGALAILALSYFIPFVLSLLRTHCGTVNGVECNYPYGFCTVYGRCNCTTVASGDRCETLACDGYAVGTNKTCSGKGICAPFLDAKFVDADCLYPNPGPENGFPKFDFYATPGWHNPKCRAKMDAIAEKIDTGVPLTDAEAASFPTCVCTTPNYGRGCETSACPMNLAFEVCSNYGLQSVGIFNNYTGIPGNGCQCQYPFFLIDIINRMSNETRERVRRLYPGLLEMQFCGEAVIHPDAVYIRTNVDFETGLSTMRCFCQNIRSGPICDRGRCPEDAFGNACSGYGSPLVGNGVEFNTTRRIARTFVGRDPTLCDPICAAGFQGCARDHTCRKWGRRPCDAALDDVCPPARPLRCRGGTCVARPDPLGSASKTSDYEYGWLDNWETLTMRRCDGFAECELVPGAVTRISSPLVGFSMFVRGPANATAKLVYESFVFEFAVSDDPTAKTRFAGLVPVQPYADARRYVFSNYSARVSTVDASKYYLIPSVSNWHVLSSLPLFDVSDLPNTRVRLVSEFTSTFSVFKLTGREEIIEPYDAGSTFQTDVVLVIKDNATTAAVATDGTDIELQNCLGTAEGLLGVCAWTVTANGSLATSNAQTDFLCADFTISTGAWCAGPPLSTRFTPRGAYVAEPSLPFAGEDGTDYTIQVVSSATADVALEFFADEGIEIFDANFILKETVAIPHACQPAQDTNYYFSTNQNQSWYNELWSNQDSRRSALFQPGDHVAFPFVYNGEKYFERGTVLSIDSNALINTTDTVTVLVPSKNFAASGVLESDLRFITSSEFDNVGLLECPSSYVSRTPDGKCALPFVGLENVTTDEITCALSNGTFTCSNGCRCREDVACDCTDTTASDRSLEEAIFDLLVRFQIQTTCEVPSAGRGTSTNGWLDDTGVFELDADAAIRAVFIQDLSNCSVNYTLWAKDVRYVDGFTLVPFATQTRCDFMVVDESFDFLKGTQFKVFDGTAFLVNGAEFILSPFRTQFAITEGLTYTTSSASQNASNLANSNRTFWAADANGVESVVWARLDFDTPRVISDVWMNFKSATVTVANITVAFEMNLEALADGNWVPIAAGFRVSATAPVVVASVDVRTTAIRIRSDYPFSMYEFIAYTNQTCFGLPSEVTRLVLTKTLHDVPSELDVKMAALGRVDYDPSTEACICVDACGGSTAGACEDEFEVARSQNAVLKATRTAVITQTAESYYRASLFDVSNQNVSLSFYNVTDNTSVPTASPTASIVASDRFQSIPYDVFFIYPSTSAEPGSGDVTAAVAAFAYYNASGNQNLTSDPAVLVLFLYHDTDDVVLPYFIPNTTTAVYSGGKYTQYFSSVSYGVNAKCPTGYSCTPCGPSIRKDGPAPGVTCDFTERELSILALRRERNATGFFSSRAFEIKSSFEYSVSFILTYTTVAFRPYETQCPFGKRCEDGTCAVNGVTCAGVRYNCPGDGCVPADSRVPYYKCACAEGHNGLDCGLDVCKPPVNDYTTFINAITDGKYSSTVDPHGTCTCNAPPPLARRPPVDLLLQLHVTLPVVERFNRRIPPKTQGDVRWVNVMPIHAPYPPRIVVERKLKDGTRIVSSCPPAHRGPFGQYLMLKDDKLLDPVTGAFLGWRVYYDSNGKSFTYPWTSETTYDDLPYRCPSNYQCVEGPERCPLEDAAPCSNHGTCMADGTCRCDSGWTTFYTSNANSRIVSVPYAVDTRFNLTNPTIWKENTDWRDFPMCNARDCSVQDCSPPVGCFPGTPPLFKDKLIRCVNKKSIGAHSPAYECAASAAACARGETVPAEVCSRKGILRRADGRDPPEYYCECGDPRFVEATQSTELVNNGFGGNCDVYECSDTSPLRYVRWPRQWDQGPGKESRLPFTDVKGNPLRGKWTGGGSCGAPIGPDPADSAIWQTCCGTLDLLERCDFVPCQIGNELRCVLAEECLPSGGVPRVFVCNNHGRALASGSCLAEVDDVEGTGYTVDLERFPSFPDNKFKFAQCPRSKSTNSPCNEMEACSKPRKWIVPPSQPAFNDQIEVLIALLGLPVTNDTVISLVSDVDEVASVRDQAFADEAIRVIEAKREIKACVCIYPNDNCSAPIGMLPYCDAADDIGPYGKNYRIPHYIDFSANGTLQSALSDHLVSSLPLSRLRPGEDYYNVSSTAFAFTKNYTLQVIRLHAFPTRNQTTMSFVDGNGNAVCTPFVAFKNHTSDWYEVYCEQVWTAVDFTTFKDYAATCVPDRFSASCQSWEKSTCQDSGFHWTDPGSLALADFTRGCTASCCQRVPPFVADVFTSTVLITGAGTLYVDEVQFYGYATTVLRPIAPRLRQELANKSTRADGTIPAAVDLPDQRFAEQLLGEDLSYFAPGEISFDDTNQTRRNFSESKAACLANGGWIAAPRINQISDGNDDMARVCLSRNTGKGWTPNCFIGSFDANFIRHPNLTDFFLTQCTLYGAYFNYDGGFKEYVSARLPEMYATSWGNDTTVSTPSPTYVSDVLEIDSPRPRRSLSLPTGGSQTVSTIPIAITPDTGSDVPADRKTYSWIDAGAFFSRMHAETGFDYRVDSSIPGVSLGRKLGYVSPGLASLVNALIGATDAFSLTYVNYLSIYTIGDEANWNPNGPWTFWEMYDPRTGASDYLSTRKQCTVQLANVNWAPGTNFNTDLRLVRTITFNDPVRLQQLQADDESVTMCDPKVKAEDQVGCCSDREAGDPLGYCGIRGRDAFSYDDFGRDILHYSGAVSHFDYVDPKTKYYVPFIPGTNTAGGIRSMFITKGCTAEITYPVFDNDGQLITYRNRIFPDTSLGESYSSLGIQSLGIPDNSYPVDIRIYPERLGQPRGTMRKIKVEFAAERTTPPLSSLPNGEAELTMGWAEYPHMCQHVRYTVLRSFTNVPYAERNFHFNQLPYKSVYETVGVTPITTVDPLVFAKSPGDVSYPYYLGNLRTCKSMGRDVRPAAECDIRNTSNYLYDVSTYRGAGFPQQASAGRDADIVVYRWRRTSLATTNDELYPRLSDMANDATMHRGYVRNSVKHTMAGYRKLFGKDWCLTINARSRFYQTMACDMELNYVCMLDYAKYVAQPGTVCDVDGTSGRSGGFARENTTCYDDFDLANATKYPELHKIADLYEAGTLKAFLRRNERINADEVRKYFDAKDPQTNESRPLIWAIPEARKLWDDDFVSLPGFASDADADPVTGLDFSISTHYGVDCGRLTSRETGETNRFCAVEASFCDADLVFNISYLDPASFPSILDAIADPNDIPFAPSCGSSVRPSTFVQLDKYGGVTAGLAERFNVLESKTTGIKIKALQSTVQLYNTGKNPLLTSFSGAFNVTGTFMFDCGGCANVVNVTIWVAPLDPHYFYPASPLVLFVTQITQGTTTYIFNATVDPNSTIVYQTLGWVFEGMPYGSILDVSNAVVTDATAFAKCSVRRGKAVRELPYPVTKSTVPDHRCILTEEDRIATGASALGECKCAYTSGGKSCDCPAHFARGAKSVCGGFGAPGKANAPDGTLAVTSDDEEETGCYSYFSSVTKETRFACKCESVARIIVTRMITDAAYDYLRAFEQDNTFGESPYVLVSTGRNFSFDQVTVATLSAATVLPSWVNGEEMDDYLLVGATGTLFLDMRRHNFSVDGNTDIMWESRGIPLAECDNSVSCESRSLKLSTGIVAGVGNWTTDLIRAINVGNLLFKYNASSTAYDGETTFAPVSSPLFLVRNESSTLYLWVSSGSFAVPTCTPIDVSPPRYVYSCANNVSVTFTGTASVGEIQLFENAMRTDFYAY